MSKGTRPAVCSVTGKRLRAKSWFYRDGKYFYNKQVWRTEQEKLAAEAAKAKTEKPAEAGQAPEAKEPAKDAKPAAS